MRSGWAIPTHTIPADFAALTPEDASSNAIRSQGVCPQALCSFQKNSRVGLSLCNFIPCYHDAELIAVPAGVG